MSKETNGIALRDYFAAHATRDDIKPYMEGPRTTQLVKDMNGYTYEVNAPIKRTIEQAKYLYADAMLKAREQ